MHTKQYTLHSAHYIVYTTQYTLHSAHYTVHTTQYILHSIHYAVHTAQYTLHSAHYTVHSTHYTVYTIQCTVCNSISLQVEEGNVEYKLKLVNPNPTRIEHLVTQMKWRLREGLFTAYCLHNSLSCGSIHIVLTYLNLL